MIQCDNFIVSIGGIKNSPKHESRKFKEHTHCKYLYFNFDFKTNKTNCVYHPKDNGNFESFTISF